MKLSSIATVRRFKSQLFSTIGLLTFYAAMTNTLLADETSLASENNSIATSASQTTTEQAAEAKVEFWAPRKMQMQFGMRFESNDNQCTNLFATIPFPKDWPEQKITILSSQLPENARYKERELPGGAKQLLLSIASLSPHQSIDLLIDVAIEKSFVNPPSAPDTLVFPSKKLLKSKDLQWYLGDSPMIETNSKQIRDIVKQIKDQKPETAWKHVEGLYDWVRNNIQYRNGVLRSTKEALKDRSGDCEEMTSLFVALCRASNIPARCVWIPEHCYPEFLLEDANGFGHWYPCQVAGDRQFGQMHDYRPILQKGDRFKVPETKSTERYVAEFFKCDTRAIGPTKPEVTPIRNLGELQNELQALQAATEPKAAVPVENQTSQ